MGGNNGFFENFERNKHLKKLPSMQRVKKRVELFADPMEDQFAKRKDAKRERTAKNELKRLRNIARTGSKKGK